MKMCERCGSEIATKDGENRCPDCERDRSRPGARRNKRMMESVLRDCGLVKVKGALGGTYWE